MLILEDILEKLGISHHQLIVLGMPIGTDYNPGGVTGFGPKRALELVREHKTLSSVLNEVAWNSEVPAEDIFAFFLNQPQPEYETVSREIDEERVKQILCDRHDFSEERIESAFKKFSEKKAKDQKSLSKWF